MSDRKVIAIPPRGTRGSSMPFGGALMRLAKPLMDLQVSRYRRTAGPTPPQMMGFPVILLTTLGARSGIERTHVLGGFEVGNRKLKVVPDSLKGSERESAYARVVAVAPRYAGYLKKTDREIPVVRLTPAS